MSINALWLCRANGLLVDDLQFFLGICCLHTKYSTLKDFYDGIFVTDVTGIVFMTLGLRLKVQHSFGEWSCLHLQVERGEGRYIFLWTNKNTLLISPFLLKKEIDRLSKRQYLSVG
jgi:hypothetical protein